jgi:hypothetical protein
MVVFWVVAPYGATHRPDDGGSRDLRNVGKLLPDWLHGATPQKTAIFSSNVDLLSNEVIHIHQ